MRFYLLYIIILVSADFAFAQDDSVSLEQTINNAVITQQAAETPSWTEDGFHGEQVDVKKFDQKKWKEIVGGENYSELQPVKKRKKTPPMRDSANSQTGGKRLLKEDYDDSEEESDGGITIPINPFILK
ncbi:MAG TPA: hypothetical protein VGQ59_12110, partial [Cyclobacteriaceae bacterium]|nr:hypothetical protein [Cyclobacteriaceae bacterium]